MTISAITLTDAWQSIGTGKTLLVCRPKKSAQVFIGTVLPAASDPGLSIVTNVPIAIPYVSELGGSIWVRGVGVLEYATA